MPNVLPSDEDVSVRQDTVNLSRRGMIGGAAAGLLLGAAGLSPRKIFAQPAQPEQQNSDDEDPQMPPGLKPGGQPDNRFPVTYERSVPAGMRVLTQYFSALARRDLSAMAETVHFPFVTYEGTETVIINSRDELMANPPSSMNVSSKGNSLIQPGAYDVMENVKALLFDPVGAGFALESSRYSATGQKLFGCHGLYGITNNDGKWGIEYMSTIFNPADQLYETFDAEEVARAMHDNQRLHALARKERDVMALRKTTQFAGRFASVGIGGSNATAGPAREGQPMAPYRVKGVKSRLRVVELTQDQVDHPSPQVMEAAEKNMEQFVKLSGGGVGQWAQSLEFSGKRGGGGRVLAASTDKGHIYMGYTRYTGDGTLISDTRYMCAALLKQGKWVVSDVTCAFGQTMYQDHTNDEHI